MCGSLVLSQNYCVMTLRMSYSLQYYIRVLRKFDGEISLKVGLLFLSYFSCT